MNAMFRGLLVLVGLLNGKRRQAQTRLGTGLRRPTTPSVEQLDLRLVPSVAPIIPVRGSPSMGVVELIATFPDGGSAAGSGALIDSCHVLTAAHLIYSAQDGGYATSITTLAAANGGSSPFGAAFGTYERVDASWLGFSRAHPGATSPNVEDIGLVTLNRAVGNFTGWFGIGYGNSSAFYKGATFQTAGYPAVPGLSGPEMYAGSGQALGVASTGGIAFSQSSLAALPGQSGSPLWQTSARGAAVIYGVVTGADGYLPSSDAYAARITPAVYNELRSWERADKVPPTVSGVTDASQVTLRHPAVSAAPQGGRTATQVVYALDGQYWQYYAPSYWGYSVVTPWGSTEQYMTDYFTPNDYTRYAQYELAPYVYQTWETAQQPWWDLWEDPAW
jgi:V8-like Glu-specific endopeptidase